MMNLLSYIVWNPDLEAFHLGPITVRWYGLMWIIGLALAYFVVKQLYKEQKIKDELFDPLFLYCFFGILIGARLGHCIFYQPHESIPAHHNRSQTESHQVRIPKDIKQLFHIFSYRLV